MRTKKQFASILIVLLCSLFVACTGTVAKDSPGSDTTSQEILPDYIDEEEAKEEEAALDRARESGKKELSLGILVPEDLPHLYFNARHLATGFNSQSDTCHLSVRRYKNEAELHVDLTTDNAPDLLMMTNLSIPLNGNNFVDLLPMIDACPEIERGDFTGNLLNTLMMDDALYMLPDKVEVSTMVGGDAFFGEQTGWTIEEARQRKEQLGEEYYICPPYRTFDNFFHFICRGATDRFVDYENRSCHFDDGEFAQLLLLCNDFPREPVFFRKPWDGLEYYMADIDWINSTGRIHGIKYTRGDHYTYIGYPCDNRRGSYFQAASFGVQIAIPYRAKDAEASFDVIRFMLGEKHQTDERYYGIPVMAKYLEQELQKVSGEIFDHGNGIVTEITEEDIRKFRSLVDTPTVYLLNNPVIIQIIEEEAKAFFAGEKSAEEVAALIQNRAQMYLDEQR